MSKLRRPKRKVSGILLLDKPAGFTSNQALQRVRGLYQAEKAGHTGSLDPLATGLLPVCLGQATKLCGYLLDSDKRYLATAKLGVKTRTADADGEVVSHSDPASVTQAMLEAVLPQFTGAIRQIPPMYSALKQQGRRLYELAREGLEVERAPRDVVIHALELIAFDDGQFQIDVRCSKGTYVRTLAEDIAAAIGQCAHLTALRRLEVTPFRAPRLVLPEQLEAAAGQGFEALDALLIPSAAAFADWPSVTVDEERAHYLLRGQAVRVAGAPREGLLAVLDSVGSLLCIAQMNEDGMVAPKRWLAD
ncbi:MAG: tRNA pseudouridine(55) synthase TruB [Stenotrophobium sp.]